MARKTSKHSYHPTKVALTDNGKILVGIRRIAAALAKGVHLADTRFCGRNQIRRHLRIGRDEDGHAHLTTLREADELDYAVVG
jgi:hypothetical protein